MTKVKEKENSKTQEQALTPTTEEKKKMGATEDHLTDVEQAKGDTPEGTDDFTLKKRPGRNDDADMSTFKDKQEVIDVYLPVSDDAGEHLRDQGIEKEVIGYCNQYRDIALIPDSEKIEMKDHETVLSELVNISTRYVGQLNFADNVFQGVFTKYRIRLGILFAIQKKIIEDCTKFQWTKWFAEYYDAKQLRSIQVYMRLAKISDAVNFAFLGSERLQQIASLIEDRKDKHDRYIDSEPIHAFLAREGIDFNPHEETDNQLIKRQTTLAVGGKLLKDSGHNKYINQDKLEELTDSKIEVSKKFIYELNVIRKLCKNDEKKFSTDIKEYVKVCIANGKAKPVETPERKAKILNSTSKSLFQKMSDIINDSDILGLIDREAISDLKVKVEELVQKLPATENSTD